MKIEATTIFILPNKSKSGASINSMIFMVPIITIWNMAQNRVLIRDSTHTTMSISETPIALVNSQEYCSPRIRATIS